MWSDLRFALRLLAKSPGFTLVAIVTLSVGIGSAAVVFSGINAMVFKPVPLVPAERQERLLHVVQTDPQRGYDDLDFSYADAQDLRATLTTLEGLWVFHDRTVVLTGAEEPERFLGTEISFDAFHHLGVTPLLGRGFTAADLAPEAPPVALLAHHVWQNRFGGDRDIVDRVITLNQEPVTIIGVMPPRWAYPASTDLWVPMRQAINGLNGQRGYHYLDAHALLRRGVSLEQAQAELSQAMRRIALDHPATNRDIGARLAPLRQESAKETAHFSLLLLGGVMFVFLIACLNVANLLLARSATRAKEFAIRLALGAERGRLVRQLVTESLLLALLGGAGGLIVGLWGVDAMAAAIPVELPFWLDFSIDPRVFIFVLGLALVSALIFGLMPAFRATHPALAADLKEGGRTTEDGGRRASRLRGTLVVVEVALALVLLVGAGLMLRSFLHLRNLDPGFESASVLTFRTGFPLTMLEDDKATPRHFFAALTERLRLVPGVDAVGVINTLPGNDGNVTVMEVEGHPTPTGTHDAPIVYNRVVDGDYFEAVRVPLLVGRGFDAALDRADSPRVAVVDESFARAFYGSPEQALGRRVRPFTTAPEVAGTDDPVAWSEIVGVVGRVRHRLDRDQAGPTVYTPHGQNPLNFMSVVMRTARDPARFVAAARTEVLAVNPRIPIYHALPLDDLLLQTIWPRQFFSYLFTFFGLIALFLACVGIYGVMGYDVTQRTPEIGMRMALGAQPREVIRMILRRGLRLVGWGLGWGFVSAWLLAHLLAGVLYGVSPHDPPTFALVPVLLALVGLLACYLPVRRATRIDPLAAIRTC